MQQREKCTGWKYICFTTTTKLNYILVRVNRNYLSLRNSAFPYRNYLCQQRFLKTHGKHILSPFLHADYSDNLKTIQWERLDCFLSKAFVGVFPLLFSRLLFQAQGSRKGQLLLRITLKNTCSLIFHWSFNGIQACIKVLFWTTAKIWK